MRVRLDLDYRLAKVILCLSLNAWHVQRQGEEIKFIAPKASAEGACILAEMGYFYC